MRCERGQRLHWGMLLGLVIGCGDSTAADGTGSDDGSGTAIATTTANGSGSASTTIAADGTATTGAPTSDDTTATTGEPPWEGMQAGVAVRYLDRPVGISMAGYGGRLGGTATPWRGLFLGSRGFYALPSIKAMVLQSGGETLVMLKTPLMSGESAVTDTVVAKLQQRHGLDLAGRLIVTGTHSHHVHGRYWRLPDIFGAVGADTADNEVIDLLATELALTVVDAMDDMGPAQWGWAMVEDWDPDDLVYSDRRHVNDFAYGKDPRLTMMAVRRPDGPALATIINFGMHSTLLDTDNELLTEDAAGGLEMVFEERFFAEHGTPILGMFMQAGGGDAAARGGALGHQGIARAEALGHLAAPALLDLWDEIEWQDDALIDVHSQRVDLTYSYFGYDRSDEFMGTPLGLPLPVPYTWGGWQCTSDAAPEDEDPTTSMEGQNKSCIPVDVLLLGDVPHPEVHQTYLTSARLGDLFLVTLPGEPTHSVMQYLRSEVDALSEPGRPLAVMGIGYAQDHLLYLTHPDDWFQGGYESQMSLWGPFAAQTLVDTQTLAVSLMVDGLDMVPFVEQSPGPGPGGFSPRALESSLNPGTVLQDIVMDVMRTETVRLRFGAGDPSVGAPQVRVQVDPGDGVFVDVPSPTGMAGAALDNSRHDMITHYDPIPAPNGQIIAARQHEWYVDWQVPADLPAGIYRLLAEGPLWDGNARSDFVVSSAPFSVYQAPGATLDVDRTGSMLELRMQLPPTPMSTEEGWPIAGWRVLDPSAGPTDPVTVRAPLTLQFTVDGMAQPGRYDVEFDPQLDAYPFDLADAGLAPGAGSITVSAHLTADIDPDAIETPIP
ncbi:MAG: hypothetical protein K0V04_35115 [Deltaproteobacteria bacterium]|nr:hypothetical protein [Deltaproteobacteria bacterium]